MCMWRLLNSEWDIQKRKEVAHLALTEHISEEHRAPPILTTHTFVDIASSHARPAHKQPIMLARAFLCTAAAVAAFRWPSIKDDTKFALKRKTAPQAIRFY